MVAYARLIGASTNPEVRELVNRVAGMIEPGYAYPLNWNQPVGTAAPGLMKAIGANRVVFQTSYYSSGQFGNRVITGRGTVPDAGIVAMARACADVDLEICLKPHVGPDNGVVPQANLIPGGFYTNDAIVINGKVGVTAPGASLSARWCGSRVGNPNPGHYNDSAWPMGMDAYGTTRPMHRTIANVTGATTFDLDIPAGVTFDGASLCIANDTLVAPWFADYRDMLDHLIGLVLGVLTPLGKLNLLEMVDVSSEHNYMTIMYPQQWRELVVYLRGRYPDLLLTIGTGGTSDYGASVTCWDLCDVIGLTLYPSVQASSTSDDSYEDIQAKWDGVGANLATLSSAHCGKKILFAELGARPVVNAGWKPLNYSGGTYDEAYQAIYVETFFRRIWPKPWLYGFHWWTWDHPNGTGFDTGVNSYGFQGRMAQRVFERFLTVQPPRTQ